MGFCFNNIKNSAKLIDCQIAHDREKSENEFLGGTAVIIFSL
jgi:hypothetical protein